MLATFRSTRSRVIAACAAAAVVSPLVLASPSFAGVQMDNPVTGLSGCNIETGAPFIEWTVENTVNEIVDIDSATVSGAVTGSVTFTPNPMSTDESATGRTDAPVGTTGQVTIVVGTSWVDGEFPDEAVSTAVATLGPCQVPQTTTTTSTTSTSTTSTTAPSTTTTTTPPPAVTAVVVTPTFTG